MGFTLRAGIYFCVANRQVAILDAQTGRYIGLPSKIDRAFQVFACGETLSPDELASLRILVDRGVLLETASPSLPLQPISIKRPTKSILDHLPERYGLGQFGIALGTRILANAQIKHLPFKQVIGGLNTSRRLAAKRDLSDSEVQRSIAAYSATRLFMTTQDQCLKWSLAMVQFLAGYGYYPTLVLGVRMHPFAAHAWVQDGSFVLSDMVDEVATFTPLLAV